MTTATYRERLLELRRYNKRNNLDQIAPELLVDMRRCIELEHAQASAGNASGAFEASFPNFVTSRARNLRHRPMLERVELFNGGTAAASEFLTALTARAAEEVLMDGLRVFEANDVAQEAYILREGTANILIPDDTGCEQVVHTYGPGEVLGSESFFTGLSLPWSVRIVGFTRALKLTEADKRSLFAAFPEDGRAVARSLAVIVTDMRKSAALHLMWTTAEGGKLQAIRRWGKICESFMQGLAAQRAKEEQQIAETLCKLAANNLVAELQHLLQTEEVSKSTTDYEGRAAIHLAAAHGNNEVIEMLASESVSLDIIDKFGRSPLYEACINGHSSTVQLLKRLNAQLTLRDPGHELCRVVASGNKELLGLLLKAGADPAAEDYDKRTALHLAACEGDVMMTRLVMEYAECANPPATLRLLRATDRWGNTPIDEARNAGHAAITRLFAEHKLPSSGTTGQQAGRLGGRSRDSS
jgi:ankyrin repeat protein